MSTESSISSQSLTAVHGMSLTESGDLFSINLSSRQLYLAIYSMNELTGKNLLDFLELSSAGREAKPWLKREAVASADCLAECQIARSACYWARPLLNQVPCFGVSPLGNTTFSMEWL
mmetsp:Transcript_109576/g.172794  ORF Transcript_109576/g.172794 Transcript_109576/m.172794 type:complete len:118 (+) Transcript_109576:39-392(+)